MRMGIRLGRQRLALPFQHNDVDHLIAQLARAREEIGPRGAIVVAIESVYSMDGDTAPVGAMIDAAAAARAVLVVDEAHGTGVFGRGGNLPA